MKIFIDANLLIYLNVGSSDEILDLWTTLLSNHELYTNPLVLDEVLWISRKKYKVPYNETLSFLEEEILPYTTILPIGVEEYLLAAQLLKEIPLKPSDALHVASMKTNGITVIASEDDEFDKIKELQRIWIENMHTIEG